MCGLSEGHKAQWDLEAKFAGTQLQQAAFLSLQSLGTRILHTPTLGSGWPEFESLFVSTATGCVFTEGRRLSLISTAIPTVG